MSPIGTDTMVPGKGQKSGLTDDEQKRIDPAGSDAAVKSQTAETKGSKPATGDQRAAGETAVPQLSAEWSERVGEPEAWESEQPPPEQGGDGAGLGPDLRKVSGFWADAGAREAGGGAPVEDLGRECAQADDCGRVVEAEAGEACGNAPDEKAASLLRGVDPDRWIGPRLV